MLAPPAGAEDGKKSCAVLVKALQRRKWGSDNALSDGHHRGIKETKGEKLGSQETRNLQKKN